MFRNIEVDESAKPAKKIFWQKHRREIFWDLDGSLTKGLGGEVSTSNFLSPYKETFEELKECTLHRESIWNDTVICDGA